MVVVWIGQDETIDADDSDYRYQTSINVLINDLVILRLLARTCNWTTMSCQP
jgi:hypothetical protein